MCHSPARCLQKSEDGIRSSGRCDSPCGCWELNPGPLEEQPVLLTDNPSLSRPSKKKLFFFSIFCHRSQTQILPPLPSGYWNLRCVLPRPALFLPFLSKHYLLLLLCNHRLSMHCFKVLYVFICTHINISVQKSSSSD